MTRFDREGSLPSHLAPGGTPPPPFADDILTSIHDQTAALEQIGKTATGITGVTDKNAAGAAESLSVAKGLENQVDKLSRMVNRFSF